MDGTWLFEVPVKTAAGLKARRSLLETRCVVLQVAINRSRRVSVVLPLTAVLPT